VQPQSFATTETSRPLYALAYDGILRAILHCELAPGSWWKASQLAERFGVGRSPVLQVLSRLEESGFVRPVKRKGWQIAPLTLATVADVLEAWRLVAPELSVLEARNASQEDLLRLAEMTREWAPGTPAVGPLHLEMAPFTRAIEVQGNPILALTLKTLGLHVERVMNFALMHGRFADEAFVYWRDAHFDALLARDEERIRSTMIGLVNVGETEITRLIQNVESLQNVSLSSG
jgi:DNA-binding GntR family transcriptional regulator